MTLINTKHKILALALVAIVSSCSKDFLEVKPEGTALEESYYSTPEEAYSGLIAVYDILGKQSRGFENMVTMMNAGSDDHYAGGGGATDGAGIQSFSNYSIDASTIPASYWNDFYQGVFRANVLLDKLPDVPMDETLKSRYAAETKALRAHFYFELVRMFKNIPLIIEPLETSQIYEVAQANPEEVYAQIETDLKEAIPNLPLKITDLENEAGRLSQGTAMAILGKVYLYEGKNDLAASTLAQVNGTPGGTSKYGYKLLNDYNNLWVISNKFNTESILESSHTDQSNAGWGNWGSGSDEGNSINIMVGPRNYNASEDGPDYVSGWSFNPITQNLYDAMKEDPRFDATIADVKALKEDGLADYSPGYLDTGYFLKKFMPLNSDKSTGGGAVELNFKQDVYIIRLADTYLMEAEALGAQGSRAQALLDAVRARVGLASTPVSMDAIMHERRMELAGEGHRWFDLVRTGKAASVLADRGFTAGKNEIFPIPLQEMENTLIEQNPNY
ncbi:RagB/SusD family nutrient uptake outer membrane protein [Galbibacter pacificus]|uniref:RagB/SusD family nutrient uptake outer membrane protein n=1 Tax=Galbibacter pacificus TaxID=2996052 RepID=A0ABT6FTZ2_9FLAO|nr:RagB/SusD family nutrient uptake outer membrane protein [Galbibacter pacificus]MDG3583234.1 RagB/SusD family nutrient uptake outer membrane protein [Galbibacter pacificus]MDG3586715.1 RagB/SusD family nutrient uptake outer membrane protein [Galbibacter pacificus]